MGLCWAWLTSTSVQVWASDRTLWAHAVQQAPLKPRPHLNYAVALLRAGDLRGARMHLELAERVAQWPHVPAYDRSDTAIVVVRNRLVLEALAKIPE